MFLVIASAGFGRLGGLVSAALCAVTPIPWPIRAALIVAALANGELHERERRSRRALAARSFTDRLTGLRNYDYFAEALRAEVARVRRYGGCITLVLLDLDRFKAFNDRYGHAAGNRLLAGVGQSIAREKRDADVAARFGGEEFAVLVPGRGRDAAVVAERLRTAIAEPLPRPHVTSRSQRPRHGQRRHRNVPDRRSRLAGAVRAGRPRPLRGEAARPRLHRLGGRADRPAAAPCAVGAALDTRR